MDNNRLDMKSLCTYSIHGALGLLMGIGVGYIVFYMTMMLSLVISGTYATAGVAGGLITAFLILGEHIQMVDLLNPIFISLVFAGPILGFPKIRNMIIMSISCTTGAFLGYGVNFSAPDIVVYINSVWQSGLFAIFFSILSSLFAIGMAGASIAIGMYFTEKINYNVREIPRFLKITRGAGLFLVFFILFASGSLFLGVAKYATTDVSIDISSSDGNVTVFVPVILEDGIVMKMYEKPSISGNSKTEIIDTEHGKAFKINGAAPIEINMDQTGEWLARDPNAEEKFVNGFTLSTSNTTRFGDIHESTSAWIYSEKDGVMLSLSIRRDNGWGRDMRITTQSNVKLTAGWQIVKFSVRNMMYD